MLADISAVKCLKGISGVTALTYEEKKKRLVICVKCYRKAINGNFQEM